LIACQTVRFVAACTYPVHWDPYFRDYMTLSHGYRYPGQHYDHARRQLIVPKLA